MDWQLFWLATTAAATTATAISTTIALLVRRRHRPEPDWAVEPVNVRVPHPRHEDDLRLDFDGRLVNAGDGPAFRVHVSGAECTPTILGDVERRGPFMVRPGQSFVAVMHPGSEWALRVRVARADWDKAAVIVEWTRSPTRLGKRDRDTIPLREVTGAPEVQEHERQEHDS